MSVGMPMSLPSAVVASASFHFGNCARYDAGTSDFRSVKRLDCCRKEGMSSPLTPVIDGTFVLPVKVGTGFCLKSPPMTFTCSLSEANSFFALETTESPTAPGQSQAVSLPVEADEPVEHPVRTRAAATAVART